MNALGHDFVEYEGQAPTCTEEGWHPYKVCTRGDLNTYWPIAPLNHDLVQHEGLDATCIDAGWNAYEDCTRCDYTTFSEAPALGHEYVSQTFAPTCTADGYTVSTCARCSESFTVNEGEKLGHWFGEWQPDGNPSSGRLSALRLRLYEPYRLHPHGLPASGQRSDGCLPALPRVRQEK